MCYIAQIMQLMLNMQLFIQVVNVGEFEESTTGLWGVAKEVAQGSVVQYGKRRLATVVIGGSTYICLL